MNLRPYVKDAVARAKLNPDALATRAPRTMAAQDASWQRYGNGNDYGRMIEAYGFASRLELEGAALRRLAERVARLNPQAGEIGAGMLASLVSDARAIVGDAEAPPEPGDAHSRLDTLAGERNLYAAALGSLVNLCDSLGASHHYQPLRGPLADARKLLKGPHHD